MDVLKRADRLQIVQPVTPESSGAQGNDALDPHLLIARRMFRPLGLTQSRVGAVCDGCGQFEQGASPAPVAAVAKPRRADGVGEFQLGQRGHVGGEEEDQEATVARTPQGVLQVKSADLSEVFWADDHRETFVEAPDVPAGEAVLSV